MAIEIHQLTINSSMKQKDDAGNDNGEQQEVTVAKPCVDKHMINMLKKELLDECRRMIVECLEELRSR